MDESNKPPCENCNGACCREHPAYPFAVLLLGPEEDKFEHAVDRKQGATVRRVLPYIDGKCPYLSAEGHCEVHDDKPMLCRQFSCVGNESFLNHFPDVYQIILKHEVES